MNMENEMSAQKNKKHWELRKMINHRNTSAKKPLRGAIFIMNQSYAVTAEIAY